MKTPASIFTFELKRRLRLYHIDLLQIHLLYLFLLTALVTVFFFTLGLIIGTFREKLTRTLALGCFYFLSFVLLPLAVDIHTRVKTADMESQFSLELKNLELIMNVEKRLYEKFGGFKSGDAVSPQLMEEIMESLDREFKVLFEREEASRNHLLAKIRARHFLCSWYPVLFYNRSVEELSGCGGISYLEFNRFSQVLKKKFIYFYVKKKFADNAGPGKVDSFVTHDENLFYAQSHLPYGFWFGILMTLLYILTGMTIAYYRFKRLLQTRKGKQVTLKGIIDLKGAGSTYIKTPDTIFVEYLCTTCATLSGDHAPFPGAILIDGKPAAAKSQNEYTYVCCPDDIPGDIKVASLFHLITGMINPGREKEENLAAELKETGWDKRFNQLDPDEEAKIIFKFALLKQNPITIFHELMDKCSPALTLEMMTEISGLLAGGSLVIYISPFSYPNMYLKVDRYLVITKKGNEYESKKIPG